MIIGYLAFENQGRVDLSSESPNGMRRMSTRNAAEMLENYKQKMGTDLGEVFHHIRQELYSVSGLWDQYETLFSHQERVKLLNESANFLAYNIQNIFFEHVMLGLSRLTDSPKSVGRENLTIRRLPEIVSDAHQGGLQALVDDAVLSTSFCRDWRNRKIAHNDLDHKLRKAKSLEPASRQKVTDAIKTIHRIIEFLGIRYCETNMSLVQLGNDSAMAILFRLYDARKKRQELIIQRKAGEFPEREKYPDWLQDDKSFDERYRD